MRRSASLARRWLDTTRSPSQTRLAPTMRGTLKTRTHRADSCPEMTTIRTTCPRCGEVDMGPEAISLSVRSSGREGSYRFNCPRCDDSVEKRADRKIVALLVSAGVDLEPRGASEAGDTLFDQEPAETVEPLERAAGGPAFTIDDVIEFHFLLEDERYLIEFLTSSDES